ncbi:MAG: GTP-binding protein [Bacteroidaceae bacterium]|nr:GTP-binding protein [Bacteroidaceae bacterium]
MTLALPRNVEDDDITLVMPNNTDAREQWHSNNQHYEEDNDITLVLPANQGVHKDRRKSRRYEEDEDITLVLPHNQERGQHSINDLHHGYDEDEDEDEHEDHHEHHEKGKEWQHHRHHHHHHHHHDGEGEADEYGIGTFVYYRRQPMDLSRFDQFLARQWPSNIIRAKGICYFKDEPDTCYVFEQAGRQMGLQNAGQWYATMPQQELDAFMIQNPSLQRDWDAVYGDRMQKIVFIGQHLDKDAIRTLLDGCLVQEA